MSDVVRASKFLSLVLRHKPETVGITLDSAGWVDVEVLLTAMGQRMDRATLLRVVTENNKKRFEFSPDGFRIRASQGHTTPVDLGYESEAPPDRLYHGTPVSALPLIREGGLSKMDRHAVHLSEDEVTAKSVGGRRGKSVVLLVLTGTMHLNGHGKFYKSTNGVWLTDHVPPDFIIFPCSDCHKGMDKHYMVHDDLWASAGASERDVLHAECLQQRLRRKLVPADFADVPLNYINDWLPRSHEWEPT